MYKVYLYGMVTASTVYRLREDFTFPRQNTYAEIKTSYPSIGGEAANSAIMLSKLGVRTRLDGNYLSKKHAPMVRNTFRRLGVDVSRLKAKENSGTEEFVITNRDSRT